MNDKEQPWSPTDSRQPESPPNQHREQRASTDVRQGAGGSMSPQGSPQSFGSGAPQSAPAQAGGEGMGQRAKPEQQIPGTPMVDVVETPEELVVYVDTPGYDKENIHIHADANTLAVSADRSSSPSFNEDEGERGLVVERPLKLERTIPLPVHIDPEEADASYDNGVCKVTIPKEEGDKRREIGFQ